MKRIIMISLFALGLVLLADVVHFWPLAEVKAAEEDEVVEEDDVAAAKMAKIFTFDVAVDCRTLVVGSNRGDTLIINGKIFPGGTLPSGMASNDPTQPVNGVAPIGEYVIRGQQATPFPPDIASAYSSAPPGHATVYFILKDGREALTTEGYEVPVPGVFPPEEALQSVTGGIGGFRGATGDVMLNIIGRNGTKCANARAEFNIRFVRD
jgi:hypothetical protein